MWMRTKSRWPGKSGGRFLTSWQASKQRERQYSAVSSSTTASPWHGCSTRPPRLLGQVSCWSRFQSSRRMRCCTKRSCGTPPAPSHGRSAPRTPWPGPHATAALPSPTSSASSRPLLPCLAHCDITSNLQAQASKVEFSMESWASQRQLLPCPVHYDMTSCHVSQHMLSRHPGQATCHSRPAFPDLMGIFKAIAAMPGAL